MLARMPRATLHLAALAASLDGAGSGAPDTITLVPDGTFRAIDGRPQHLDGWHLDGEIAADLLTRVQARQTRLVINYEHPEPKGQPLPAAGWVERSAIRYAPGVGLTAPVTWTKRAKEMIEAQEYAYLSPVIAYDPKSGAVRDLIYAGLTNTPALDGLAPLARLAEHYGYSFPAGPSGSPSPTTETVMDLAALRALLALPEDADVAAIEQAITSLKAQAEQVAPLTEQVTALTAATGAPDPAQWVPMAVHQETLAALRANAERGAEAELSRLIDEGLAQGKIPGQATAEWLRGQGIAACRAYLEGAPAVAALTRTQTGGRGPDPAQPPLLSEAELAVCAQMQLDQATFIQTRSTLFPNSESVQ